MASSRRFLRAAGGPSFLVGVTTVPRRGLSEDAGGICCRSSIARTIDATGLGLTDLD
jgi:hypothetical protein